MSKKIESDLSVLMSVYWKENPKFLEEAIESIINQTLMPKEIIIVKDGKLTELLDEVLKTYEKDYPSLFKIIELKKNVGLGKALNIGLESCTTNLIARMDSDDISLIKRFEEQVKVMKSNVNLALVGSNIGEFKESADTILRIKKMPLTHKEIIKFSKIRNPFNHPSVMFRKNAVEDVGGYKDFYLLEDYYLWIRVMKKKYEVKNLEETLLLMRTPEDIYFRRGGRKLFLSHIKLRKYMYDEKWINAYQLIYSSVVITILTLSPQKIRKLFYQNILRTK